MDWSERHSPPRTGQHMTSTANPMLTREMLFHIEPSPLASTTALLAETGLLTPSMQLAPTRPREPSAADEPGGRRSEGLELVDTSDLHSLSRWAALNPRGGHFLPLEVFDDQNLDHEEIPEAVANAMEGRDPAACPPAKSLWRDLQGKPSWQSCRVMGRNRIGSHYLIRWDSNARLKWVSRFNLRFEGEDTALLKRRRKEATELQRVAEDATLRSLCTQAVLEKGAANPIPKIDPETLRRIRARIGRAIASRLPPREPSVAPPAAFPPSLGLSSSTRLSLSQGPGLSPLSSTGASMAMNASLPRISLVSMMREVSNASLVPAAHDPGHRTTTVGVSGITPPEATGRAHAAESALDLVVPYAGWMEVQGKWVRKAQSNAAADAVVLDRLEEEVRESFLEAQARAVVEARWAAQRPRLPALDARSPDAPPASKPDSMVIFETLKGGRGSMALDVCRSTEQRQKGRTNERATAALLQSAGVPPPRAILQAASSLEDELLPASTLLLQGMEQIQRYLVNIGQFDIFGLFGPEYRHIIPQEWLHRLLPAWEPVDEGRGPLDAQESAAAQLASTAASTAPSTKPSKQQQANRKGSSTAVAVATAVAVSTSSTQRDFLEHQSIAADRANRLLMNVWESMKEVIEDSYAEESELLQSILAEQAVMTDPGPFLSEDALPLPPVARTISASGRSESMSTGAALDGTFFRTQLERGALTSELVADWIQRRYRAFTLRSNLGTFASIKQLVEMSMRAYADCISFWSTLPEIQPLFSSYVERAEPESVSLVLRPAPESFVEQVEHRVLRTVTDLSSLPAMDATWHMDPHLDRPEPTFGVRRGPAIPLLHETLEGSPILAESLTVIKRSISTSHDRARDILDKFREFAHLLDVTDFEKFAATFAVTHGADLGKWREKIASLKHLEARVRSELPAETTLGLYRIDGTAMKASLLRTVELQHRALIHHFRNAMLRIAGLLTTELRDLLDRFTKPALTIEACYQLNRDILLLGRRVGELAVATQEVKDRMDLLESARCTLTDAEFAMLWNLRQLPSLVQEAFTSCQATMPLEMERFQRLLAEESQAFTQHLLDLGQRVDHWETITDPEMATQWRTDADELHKVLRQAAQRAMLINQREKLVGWAVSDFRTRVTHLQSRFEPYLELWRIIDKFTQLHDVWMYGAFFSFPVHELEASVPQWLKAFARIEPVIAPGPAVTCGGIRKTLTEFARYVPLIRFLRTPGMRERHWMRIYQGTGLDRDIDRKTWTLESLIQQQVDRHLGLLAEVAELATKELVVEKSVDRVDNVFSTLELDIDKQPISDKPMLKRGEDVLQSVDEALVRLQSIAVSAYVDPHIERVNFWVASLTAVRDLLESWLTVQRKYLFLEPLFSSESLLRKMPIEGRSFGVVDQQWCQIIERLGPKPRVLEVAHQKQLREKLDDLLQRLDQISKGLNDFLNFKRQQFPRFFFLSNEELLGILVSSREPDDVQPYLSKVFSGVSSFVHATHEGVMSMESVCSPEGEAVPLRHPVPLWLEGKRLPVEVDLWLVKLEESLRETMKELTEEALGTFSTMRIDRWVREWPTQIVLASSHVSWTMDVTWALTRIDRLTMPKIEGGVDLSPEYQKAVAAMRDGQQYFNRVRDKLLHVLETLGYLIALNARTISGGQVDRITRRMLTSLLISQVLQRDVTETLVPNAVASPDEFEWIRHLRQYWEDGTIVSRCVDTVMQYGYEYQGVCQRLVITPLTERAFLSMVSAINLCYGSALQGPAGTGKTETAKELARAVGRANHVFNCSEGLDMNSVAKFLTGVICTGMWICFDEFNLMGEDVLSVIAKQILTIQTALASKAETITFEGRQGIPLNPNLAIFVTMNPSSYGARSEVPDNMRSLFRPINMTVPDYTAIAEVTLYSYGFEASHDLAQRLTTFLKVVKSQLPRRSHYDFDMRALKTVLQRAGALRHEAVQHAANRPPTAGTVRLSRRTMFPTGGAPANHSNLLPEEELQLCRTALLQINMPKLSEEDAPVFSSCLRDFFPEPRAGTASEADRERIAFRQLIQEAARVKGLELTEIFISQAVQLRDTMQYRHGIMMLGPPGSGKTTTREVLSWAIEHLVAERGAALTPSTTAKGVQKVNRKLLRLARERLKQQAALDYRPPAGLDSIPGSALVDEEAEQQRSSRPSSVLSSRPVTPDQEMSLAVASALSQISSQGRSPLDTPPSERGSGFGDEGLEAGPLRAVVKAETAEAQGDKKRATAVLGFLGRSENFVRVAVVNPKSMSLAHLYGSFDSVTSNWTDGIASSIIREECSASHGTRPSWVVLDGPVDPAWVENLNSLLDDSRKLCLSSGETISLRTGVNVILEVDDIARASPATISRCGVVFFDERAVTYREVYRSWVRRMRQDLCIDEQVGDRMHDFVWHILDAHMEGIISGEYGPLQLQLPAATIAQNMLSTMECILVEKREHEIQRRRAAAHTGAESEDALINQATQILAQQTSRPQSQQSEAASDAPDPLLALFAATSVDLRAILFAVSYGAVAGVMGMLNPDGLAAAEDAVRSLLAELPSHFPFILPGDLEGIVPSTSTLVESVLDVPNLTWVPAMDRLPPLKLHHAQAFKDIYVPSADGIVVHDLLGKLLSHGRHVILMGPTGIGKTAMIRRFLSDPPAMLVRHTYRSHNGFSGAGGGGAAGGLKNLANAMAQLEELDGDGGTNSSFSLHVLEASLSSGTTPEKLQGMLEHALVKVRKNTYGAPAGLSAVMLIDDVAAAGINEFGSCATVEFLRSWMESSGWYGTEFHHTVGLRMVAALSQGSHRAIGGNARFLRLAVPILPPAHARERMIRIFTPILATHFDQLQASAAVTTLARRLAVLTVDLYLQVAKTLLPVPSSPHYLFSMRHVSRVIQGLMRAPARVAMESTTLVTLWRHEVYRTFFDGLTDDKAQRWFHCTIKDMLEDKFDIGELPEYNGMDVQFCTFSAGSNGTYEYVPYAYERYDLSRKAQELQAREAARLSEGVESDGEDRTSSPATEEQEGEGSRKGRKSKWTKFKVLNKVAAQFRAAGRRSPLSADTVLSTLSEGSEAALGSPSASASMSAPTVEDASKAKGTRGGDTLSSTNEGEGAASGPGRSLDAEPAASSSKAARNSAPRGLVSGERKMRPTRRPSLTPNEPVTGWETAAGPDPEPVPAVSHQAGRRRRSSHDPPSSEVRSRGPSPEVHLRTSVARTSSDMHDRPRRTSITATTSPKPSAAPVAAGTDAGRATATEPGASSAASRPRTAPPKKELGDTTATSQAPRPHTSTRKSRRSSGKSMDTNAAESHGKDAAGAPVPVGTLAAAVPPSRRVTRVDTNSQPPKDPRAELEDSLRMVCAKYLEQYNLANPRKPLDMVLFNEVLGHLGRLIRVLEQETGHVMLLGHGGTGRRSLARLAGYVLGLKISEVSMKPGYTSESWREDLKDVLQTAGVIGRPVMLLLRDSPFFATTVLDDLSHLVNRAEVPGLYVAEEISSICQALKPMAEAAGIRVADLERVSPALMEQKVLRLFVDRCRSNLRICLCWEEGSALLRRRLQEFPALGHCTTADFVENWGDHARGQIAMRVVSPNKSGVRRDLYQPTIDSLVAVHEVAVHVAGEHTKAGNHMYIISGSEYLQMLRFFETLYPTRMDQIVSQRLKYRRGVERMEALRHEVRRLQDTLARMRPVIQQTKTETDEIMRKIEIEQHEAEIASANAAREKELASVDAQTATDLRDSCNAELEKAMPPLRKALGELALVNKRDIAELKALRSPPAGIKLVMEAICILLGALPLAIRQGRRLNAEDRAARFWEESMKVVSDFHFLESLFNYDKDAMTEDIIVQIKGYVDMEQFSPRAIERVSKAATCMCRWVRALSLYHDTKKIVDPRRSALQQAETNLREKEELLQATLERLHQIEENLRTLRQQMVAMVAKKDQLEKEEVMTQERIVKAKRLLESLETEGERWQKQEVAFLAEEAKVLGDVILASAFVAYAGPLADTLRGSLVQRSMAILDKHGIAYSAEFRLEEVTGRKDQTHMWQEFGLPQNPTSVENAVIMDLTDKWALIIDPEEQASRWIRRTYREMRSTPLVALGLSDTRLSDQLFQALDSGSVLLLENLEGELSPLVDQALNRSTFTNSNGKLCIQLGDMAVPYHERFKLYLTTIQRKPQFGHDLTSKMCVVNFTSGHTQLVEQLTNLAIVNDHSELESERKDLTAQRVKFGAMLHDVENRVLEAIQEGSADSIIEDEGFFKVLQESQRTSREISKKAQQIANNEKRVEKTRKLYANSVAFKAAVFYMAIRDMSNINPAYQFSLKWFLGIYKQALESCRTPHLKQDDRLTLLEKVVTTTLHRLVCRSLHDRDKVLLSLLVSLRALSARGEITAPEMRMFINGGQGKTLHAKAKGIVAAIRMRKAGGFMGSPQLAHISPSSAGAAGAGAAAPAAEDHRSGSGAMGMISRLEKAAGSMDVVSVIASTSPVVKPTRTSGPPSPTLRTPLSVSTDRATDSQQPTSPVPTTPVSALAVSAEGTAHRPKWMAEAAWSGILSLFELPQFSELPLDIGRRPEEWEACIMNLVDINSELPDPWAERLRPFDKLLLVRIVRPRVLPRAAKSFIEVVLGPECSEPVPSDLDEIFQQSTCRVPILLVLIPGYHPLPMLSQFADRKRKRLLQISMGRGQGPAAEKLIRSFLTQPRWIVLENCHLAGEWTPKLKSIVDSLPTLGAHPDFRLWLTAAVTDAFPLSILQASLKVSDGLSEGLRSNLTATLQQLSAESRGILERKSDDDPALSVALQQTYRANGTLGFFSPEAVPPNLDQKDPYQLKGNAFTHGVPLRRLFAYLCFSHAILLERRHYGQLGWSSTYDFNTVDLDVSLRQLLRMSQDNPTNLDIPRLLYLMGDSFYGGRIVDVYDRRLLKALLETVLSHATETPADAPATQDPRPRRGTVDEAQAYLPPAASFTGGARDRGGLIDPDDTRGDPMDTKIVPEGQPMTLRSTPKSGVVFHPALPPLNVDLSFNQMLMLIDKNLPDTARPDVLGLGLNAGLMKLDALSGHILKAVRKAQGNEISLENIQMDADGEVSFHNKEAEILELARTLHERIPHELSVHAKHTPPRSPLAAPKSPIPALSVSVPSAVQRSPKPFEVAAAQEAVATESSSASAAVDHFVDALVAEHASQVDVPSEISCELSSDSDVHPVGEGMKKSSSFAFNLGKDSGAGHGQLSVDAEASTSSVTFVGPPPAPPPPPAAPAPAPVPPPSPSDDMEIWRHVLRMEVAAVNSILSKARTALQTMIHAFEGLEPLTAPCTQLMTHVHRGEVPKEWAQWSFNLNCESLGTWLQSLEARCAFLNRWIGMTHALHGDVRAALPVVPLGRLFRPRSFLQAVLRDYARRNDILVNQLIFECQFVVGDDGAPLPEPREPPVIGCYLSGMHLRAAAWNQAQAELEDARAEDLYTKLPVVWIRPFKRDDNAGGLDTQGSADVPLGGGPEGAGVQDAQGGENEAMEEAGSGDMTREQSRRSEASAGDAVTPSSASKSAAGSFVQIGAAATKPQRKPQAASGSAAGRSSAAANDVLDVPRGFEDHYWCPVYRGQGSKLDIHARLEGDDQEASYAGDSSLMCLPLQRGSRSTNEWATRGVAILALSN